MHVLPPDPQARSSDPGWHELNSASQQPLPQVDGPHPLPEPPPAPVLGPQMPALQVSVPEQGVHAPPFLPQFVDVGGS